MKPKKEMLKMDLFTDNRELKIKLNTQADMSIRRLITANPHLNMIHYGKVSKHPITKQKYTNPKYAFDVIVPAIRVQNTNITSGIDYPYAVNINLNPYIEHFYTFELESAEVETMPNKWGIEKHLLHDCPGQFIWDTLDRLELPFNIKEQMHITYL